MQILWQVLRFAIVKFKPGSVVIVSILLAQLWITSATSASRNYEYINGLWFDGQTFVGKRFYSVNGVLTSRKPGQVDSVIDLNGKFVIPPFAEAHNHNVESSRIDRVIKMYLEAGIFYVKNPNSLPRFTAPLRGKINISTSIDVIFANGGLTGIGGHPVELVQRNINRKIWTEADGEGSFYFTIDNQADLVSKWPAIEAGKPDFIKTYLLYSEEYDKRKDDPQTFGWRGLNPTLLPEIVKRARLAGLRVSTHVESAADFHNAVMAGVDEINHMPGFRGSPKLSIPDPKVYEIAETDARLAGRKGIVVVTTLSGIRSIQGTLREQADQLHRRNLNTLKKHHVRVAVGSDEYGSTSATEAMYLSGLKVFSNLELLKMWCEATAETIFPKRKIGHLKDGYEASFLVLSADPITDFANTQKVEIRVKQGEILSLSTPQ